MITGPSPPLQNSPPPENKRLKRLILAAQIFSVFAFMGILVIFSWTARKVSMKNKDFLENQVNDLSSQLAATDTTASMTDTMASVTDLSSNSTSDEGLLSQAEMQKAINESLYEVIKRNTPDTTPNRPEVMISLNDLKRESNVMSGRIENLYQGFKDTLDQIGGSSADYTSERYFVDSGRDRELRDQLLNYRTEIINSLNDLQIGYTDDLKSSLPVDQASSSPYVTAWDWGKFSVNPSVTLSYLRELEVEVRNFEAAALNKYPQTITY